ncbi:CRISPR-associated protein Csm3 [Marinitoga sp. 1155]|nr:CRISPR-associated protein Csm3 [Marinitoga sp. 1155]
MTFEFIGKHIIKGKIKLLTGLHIGGTNEGFQIGGIDNVVIKNPLTDEPIIPGSTLKGKMRSLLEWKYAKIEIDEIERDEKENIKKLKSKVQNDENSEFILKLFGKSNDLESKEFSGPVRLIFRDATLTDESKKELERYLGKNIYTEVKAENSIDRLTSVANPRFMERVIAGSEFEFEIVMDNYTEEDYKNLKYLFEGLLMLEDSYLGGGGSRGNGKVEIEIEKIIKRKKEYYESGEEEIVDKNFEEKELKKPLDFLKNFNNIKYRFILNKNR